MIETNKSDGDFSNKLYEILATLNYNSERREVLEEILERFLAKQNPNVNIAKEARKIAYNEIQNNKKTKSSLSKNDLLKSELFRQGRTLFLGVFPQYVPEYLIQKFFPYEKEFKNKFKLDVACLLVFYLRLAEYMAFKQSEMGFKDTSYKFSNKEEYADLGFVALPDRSYIEKWRNVISFSLSELKRLFLGVLTEEEIEKILEIVAINKDELRDGEKTINFCLTPLLKIDEDAIVLMTPHYMIKTLPLTYEILFRKCRSYLNSKGKSFEKLVQNTLKELPFTLLSFNTRYGKNFEVDGIIKFKKSIWFVEVSSHPPSLKSLRGDLITIERDLEKTIRKCIAQGERCLKHTAEEPLKSFSQDVNIKGVIVVVDGVYPQLNITTAFSFFKEDLPIYVINWFDLRSFLDQPELAHFEEFLLWRTQKPMPIICLDEKDYWSFYFDHYCKEKEMRDAFKKAQKRDLRCIYISARFNDKEYLEKIAKSS